MRYEQAELIGKAQSVFGSLPSRDIDRNDDITELLRLVDSKGCEIVIKVVAFE